MVFNKILTERLGLFIIFIFWPLWRLVLATFMPLTPDEAYYSLWAQHLQLSYYDHPFMVAWWIKAGIMLFGPHVWAMRFVGVVASLLASWAFYQTARLLFSRQRDAACLATLCLNTTFPFGLGMAVITPDTPVMVFLILTLWAFSQVLFCEEKGKNSTFWWVLLGVFGGLAADSKYSIALFALGMAGFVLCFRPLALWRRKGLYYAVFTSVVVFMPVLLWNAAHQWASFFKQGGRLGTWQPARGVSFLTELFAGQIGLLTPVLFILCCSGMVALYRHRREPVPCLLLWLVVPGGVFFVIHALGDRVQANWPSILYPPLILAATYGLMHKMQKWRLATYAVGCGMLMQMLFSLQALYSILPLPAHFDPVARQSAGWDDLARAVQVRARQEGADAIVVEDYALASILAVQAALSPQKSLGNSLPVLGADKRWDFLFSLPRYPIRHPLFLYERRPRHEAEEEESVSLARLRTNGWHKPQTIRTYRLSFEREDETRSGKKRRRATEDSYPRITY